MPIQIFYKAGQIQEHNLNCFHADVHIPLGPTMPVRLASVSCILATL